MSQITSKNIYGKEMAKYNSRVRGYLIDPEALFCILKSIADKKANEELAIDFGTNLFTLEGSTVKQVYYDHQVNKFVMGIHHSSFPEVEEGSVLPLESISVTINVKYGNKK